MEAVQTDTFHQDIEQTFIQLRGKGVALPTRDYPLLNSWYEQGVPLGLILRVMKESFEKNPDIGSIRYFDPVIRKEMERLAQMRVGESRPSPPAEQPQPSNQFADHLARVNARLEELWPHLPAELATMVESLGWRLMCQKELIVSGKATNYEVLETLLTEMEAEMYEAASQCLTDQQHMLINLKLETDYSRFKKTMPKDGYNDTITQAKFKAVLEHFDLPRLSLFFMRMES